MKNVTRYKPKLPKIFLDGGVVACKRCGFYEPRDRADRIKQSGRGYLCFRCWDKD